MRMRRESRGALLTFLDLRAACVLLTLSMLPVGVQAQTAPQAGWMPSIRVHRQQYHPMRSLTQASWERPTFAKQ
jgi:hypothetical protein